MIIPSKEDFMKQVSELNINDKNIESLLIDLYKNIESNYDKEDDINKIINYLFPNLFTKDNMIPYSFIFTPVGNVIFMTLFNNDNYCTMNDVINYSAKYTDNGFSRQYLNQEIHSGRLKAQKVDGRWLFRKSDVKKYFKEK